VIKIFNIIFISTSSNKNILYHIVYKCVNQTKDINLNLYRKFNMSRYILNLILILFSIVYTKNSFANYNEAINDYNNKNWLKVFEHCDSELEDLKCLNLLGVMHLNGLGTKIDYINAKKYFINAKELGSKNAEFNLGWMALKGLGEEINLELASKYFKNSNSKNKIIVKNLNTLDIESEKNLIKLKRNNLISKYGYFYTNYIKLEKLFHSKLNIENQIIKNISQIKNKLDLFDALLIEKDENIIAIKNNINKEQEIIVKLLLIEVDKDLDKFEEAITKLYSVLQNFDINNI
tara:strand:- start:2070 stop:2942 length:873 start_codon:yes stop_codon:yes gene_type:complete